MNYRGMFYDGISYHYIENVKRDLGNKYHVLYKHEDLRTNHTCGKWKLNLVLFFVYNIFYFLFSGFHSTSPELVLKEVSIIW